MIVGEYPDEVAEQKGRPIAGPSYGILQGILQQAGISRDDYHLTNVMSKRPAGNRLEYFCGPKNEAIANYRPLAPGKFIHAKWQPELDRLQDEIRRVNPNVIVALGNMALWALCKKSGIKKYRGSPLPTFDKERKVIPTWHPRSIMRQWELRVIVLSDFVKARAECTSRELVRPYRELYLEPSISDIEAFYHDVLAQTPAVSCDIETKMHTITEVGYGNAEGTKCMVIPFYARGELDGNYWRTLEEERAAWDWCRRINLLPLFGQNFAYDMQYFWRTVGIPCPNFCDDTMLLHHSLQPELEKGLGFLASVYTTEPSWKFMRTDHSTMKRGDD